MSKKIIKSSYKRDFQIESRAINEDDRTVELAFSSEHPVERWFGREILDHDPASVDLGRLRNGGAVLVDHDTRDHVGVVESAEISADRRGRAVVRFGRGVRASEIYQDVVDGIRKLVSVSYSVEEYKRETEGKDGEPDTYRMTRWTPAEISVVSVPADINVGVGRSADEQTSIPNSDGISSNKEDRKMKEGKPTDPAVKPEETPVDIAAVTAKARSDEQTRIRNITSTGEEFDCDEMARQHIDEGKSFPEFKTAVLAEIGKRNVEIRAKDKGDDDKSVLGLSGKEQREFNLPRAMLALSDPNNRKLREAAAFEFEVSDEGAKKLGITPRGLFIPSDVPFHGSRALSAGTATDGAELVADNLLAGSFIDVLRNRLVTAQAGMTMLSGLVGNVDIPRKTSGSSATWLSAEDADATVSDPQFDQVSLTPKDLAVFTEVTRRLMLQSTPSIDGIVRADLAAGMATGIDAAALYGTGATGQPEGVANVTGINTFNFAAAAPTYAETVRMIREVMTDNADIGSLGYIIDPAGWEDAMTTAKDSGSGLFVMSESGTINGRGVQTSNQVTAEDWFYGNWADLLMGLWGGLELNVDPYTHSLKGKTRYVMFQTVDTAVRHPASFCHCNDGV